MVLILGCSNMVLAADSSPVVKADVGGDQKVVFAFKDADLSTVISEIGKITGKTFIVDPAVHGKITIQPQGPMTVDEAYKAFNIALMINGYSIVDIGNFTAIEQAQNIQRTQIPVYEKLPADLPARMITYVRKLKYASAKEIYNSMGPILQSRMGEMRVFEGNNELVTSDFAPNQYRIAELLDQFDTPEAAANSLKWKKRDAEAAANPKNNRHTEKQ